MFSILGVNADEFLTIHFPGFLITFCLIIICILIHFEALSYLSKKIEPMAPLKKRRMLLFILGTFVAHLVEIWVFAFGYLLMGELSLGNVSNGEAVTNLIDLVYFSAVTYTTIGYGDVIPMGATRFLAGMEALSGLILIGWSASFAFIEMNRFWKK